jgi:hypothetical protein
MINEDLLNQTQEQLEPVLIVPTLTPEIVFAIEPLHDGAVPFAIVNVLERPNIDQVVYYAAEEDLLLNIRAINGQDADSKAIYGFGKIQFKYDKYSFVEEWNRRALVFTRFHLHGPEESAKFYAEQIIKKIDKRLLPRQDRESGQILYNLSYVQGVIV